ncbi:hypothetical protein AB0E63_12290 [Kribbella sp. NPDC026596]|uniref:hypothetical protein n=1 Tax=Kribbella sp. NPDC026596 TaxID=3155122 RepID=UPI0033E9CB86
MLLAIISVTATLTVAIIAAVVALRTKRMELAAKVDDRRNESLQRGYDLVLASTDLIWHYYCHIQLDAVGWGHPKDWDDKFPRMKNQIDATMTAGVDLLKQHSSHYENVSAVLRWIYRVTREGYTLNMMSSTPNDYGQVRDALILCARTDARLGPPIKANHWKRVAKENRPRDFSDLDASEALSRMFAIMDAHGGATMMLSSATEEGQNMLLAYLDSFNEAPKVFVPSLATTEGRINDWISKGVLDYGLFCSSGQESCSDTAQRRLRALLDEESDE